MRLYTNFILLSVALMLIGCSSYVIQSPSDRAPVVLGGAQSQCTPGSKQRQWGLLFGVYPIKKAAFDESILRPDRTYRISESYEWQDALISVVGGALLSLNVKTISVEECKQRFVVRTQHEIEQEEKQSVQAGLDLYMKLSSQTGDETVIIMKSGETRVGRIESFDDKSIVILSKPNALQGKPVDRVILRGGQTLLGNVLRQNKDSVVIRTATGLRSIPKNTIQTILYHKPTKKEGEAESSKGESERIAIPREEIRKIVLRNSGNQSETPSPTEKLEKSEKPAVPANKPKPAETGETRPTRETARP